MNDGHHEISLWVPEKLSTVITLDIFDFPKQAGPLLLLLTTGPLLLLTVDKCPLLFRKMVNGGLIFTAGFCERAIAVFIVMGSLVKLQYIPIPRPLLDST